ncbi:YbfB/YjiJ family MFS transporter [Oxalobacteraceae bacterium]|nr:YbfB/YjiJ family MFS transporter [Oxalobacteraceae bacterium]
MTTSSNSIADTAQSAATAGLGRALAGLAALAVAMGIGRFAFTPVMPMMLHDAGLSIAAGAWLASANYVGYLLGALSAMAWRLPAPLAIRGGLLVISAVTLAMAAPLPFGIWMGLRLLAGVASAWVLISVSAWCMDTLAVYRRPFLNSLVFAGVGCGIAGAGLLCLLLSRAGAASASAWATLGGAAAAISVLVWRCFPAGPAAPAGPGAPASGLEAGRMRWSGAALRLVCCYGVFGFGYIIPATFLPVMTRNVLQDPALFGWAWPVFGLAAAISTLMVARLKRRFSNRQIWAGGQLLLALGALLPIVWPQLLALFGAALCVGGTFMVITLVALQEARALGGRHGTTLIAAMTAAFAAGQIIGPLTVRAAGHGNASFAGGLLLAAGLLVASTLLLRRGAGSA